MPLSVSYQTIPKDGYPIIMSGVFKDPPSLKHFLETESQRDNYTGDPFIIVAYEYITDNQYKSILGQAQSIYSERGAEGA